MLRFRHIRPGPRPERIKSRLPSRYSQQPLGRTNNGTVAAVPSRTPIEVVHQTLSVVCKWYPGQPTDGLTWKENAYLALTGIASSQLELFHTGDTEKANETLDEFLAKLHMDCDAESYESWRQVVTGLWRGENERSRNGRSSHSIQLLLDGEPLNTPPRDCMGAVQALGLLQDEIPHDPETKREYLNPLFLLKYKYPEVTFDEISSAFDTELDEKAFSVWNARVTAIMECMGPMTSQPVFIQHAGGYLQSNVTYADYLKAFTCAVSNLGELRFASFGLNEAIHLATSRFTAVKSRGPPPGTPEDCLPRRTRDEENRIHNVQREFIDSVFEQLSEVNLATKNCGFKAVAEYCGQPTGSSFMSPDKHFIVLIPLSGKEGGLVKINGKELSWNPTTGFILDESVPFWTDSPISYAAIFCCKF